MYKFVEMNGQQAKLVSNALLPRLYRSHFGSDLMVDFRHIKEKYDKDGDETFDTTIFERITWLMLKQGGNDVGETIDEWLENTDLMDFYNCIGTVVGLLQESQKTTAKPKKK